MVSEGKGKQENWIVTNLSSLGEMNRGRSRHRPRYAEHLYGGPYPFIQTGDVKASNGRVTKHTQTYSEAGLAQSKLWPSETLCITIAANIAETAILTYPACFPDSIIGFTADKEKCDVYFIEYMFRYLKRKIQHEATGTVQDNINMQTLERLSFQVPPLSEQKAIAHILGSLDDKIELNRKTNKTLEAMAQALFKSWFVDFDPVIDNALAAGKPIPEEFKLRAEIRKSLGDTRKLLPEEVRALFPSEFVRTEEMGRIPRGWEIKSAESIADISIGKTPPRKEQQWFSECETGNEIWVSIRDMGCCGAFIGNSAEYLTKESINRFNVKKVPKNSILVSFKLTVGRVAIAQKDLTTNEAIAHFVDLKRNLTREYLYCYLKGFDYNKLGSTSSIATAVNSKIIKKLLVLIPDRHIVEQFTIILKENFDKVSINIEQIEILSKLRDFLLPNLLSGEMCIREAKKTMEKLL